jgi:hypothetical protein
VAGKIATHKVNHEPQEHGERGRHRVDHKGRLEGGERARARESNRENRKRRLNYGLPAVVGKAAIRLLTGSQVRQLKNHENLVSECRIADGSDLAR